MKKSVFPIFFVTLLTACHVKPELRKDIKEFVSQFSLKAAMEQYKTGGYTSTKETRQIGQNTLKEVIEMEFSIIDDEHPTYVETTTNYENDEISSQVEVRFVEQDDEYYISTNGELKKSSLKEYKKYITRFFYKKVDLDGQYHTQGFYYGDYLKEVAPNLQNYVTIDQERELYIMEYHTLEKQGEVTAEINQMYTVNKWGMLNTNHYMMGTEEKTVTQDIIVHN